MRSHSLYRFLIKGSGIASVSLLLVSCTASAAPSLFRAAVDVPLPGAAVRFDYQSLDVASGRLYISHMGDGHVVVFDIRSNRVIANIPGVPGSTGVLAVPAVQRIYASASGSGEVAAIDQRSLHVIARMPAGRFPDGIAYDPIDRKLFVSDESGGMDIVLDAQTNRPIASIRLGGGVGNTQYDPGAHLILATVGARNDIAVIDPRTNRVKARYPLPGSDRPHGLYLDTARRLAFIACEGNARLLVLNLRTMQVIASFSVGSDPDVLAFDPGLRRLYVACESGIVSVFDEAESSLVKRGDVFIAPEAHSVAVDPATHRIFLPLENAHGRPALRILVPH